MEEGGVEGRGGLSAAGGPAGEGTIVDGSAVAIEEGDSAVVTE